MAVAEPLRFDNVHSGDFNVPLQTALATAMPLGYALQNCGGRDPCSEGRDRARFFYGEEAGEH